MDNLAGTLEKHWNLYGVAVRETLQAFDNRQVVRFAAREGDFVCKIIAEDVADRAFARRTAIYGFLEERGFAHAPRLLETKRRSTFIREGGSHIIVMEHVPGESPAVNPENYGRLGGILASLNGLAGYPHPALISVDAVRRHFAGIAEGLPAGIRARFLAVAKALPDIDALPHSLIHFEASLKNAVRRPDGTIVIVDWDEAGVGATVLDPGYHLISQFVSESLEFDADSARAFYGAYLAVHPLSDVEKRHLFDASLFHALRYVVWGDKKKRWARIRWAMEHRPMLEETYR